MVYTCGQNVLHFDHISYGRYYARARFYEITYGNFNPSAADPDGSCQLSRQVGEDRKMAAHSDACRAAGILFVPLVMETLGGWSDEAIRTIRWVRACV